MNLNRRSFAVRALALTPLGLVGTGATPASDARLVALLDAYDEAVAAWRAAFADVERMNDEGQPDAVIRQYEDEVIDAAGDRCWGAAAAIAKAIRPAHAAVIGGRLVLDHEGHFRANREGAVWASDLPMIDLPLDSIGGLAEGGGR